MSVTGPQQPNRRKCWVYASFEILARGNVILLYKILHKSITLYPF
nr:MAG TPA: immunity protein [Caudoviricetes sp.]